MNKTRGPCPKTSLASQIGAREISNLNLIRLLLALLVVFSHSFPLSLGGGFGRPDPDLFYQWTRTQVSFGGLAVNAFFFLSGFLITNSWLRSKSVTDYLRKRILRIYPGFAVAMSFSAALVWALCPEFRTGLTHPLDWLWRWAQDVVFLDSRSISQTKVFATNPLPWIANGSLWTIPIEFKCYLAVLAVGVLARFKRRLLLLAAVLLGYEFCVALLFHGDSKYDQFSICFAFGALAWLWKDKVPFSGWIACGCLVVLVATSHFRPWFSVVFPPLGGYCLLWLAYGPTLALSRWAAKTDLSYGACLYAFPVQQTLAMHGPLRNPWLMFVIAVPITLLLAGLSWHWVEKPCLALKRRSPDLPDLGAALQASCLRLHGALLPGPATALTKRKVPDRPRG